MNATLKTRLIFALKTAAGSARSSEFQVEANDLVSMLQAMDDPPQAEPEQTGPEPVSAAAHDDLRQSVQASAGRAEAAVYAKVNAPTETPWDGAFANLKAPVETP
jgi:hypothetical protein